MPVPPMPVKWTDLISEENIACELNHEDAKPQRFYITKNPENSGLMPIVLAPRRMARLDAIKSLRARPDRHVHRKGRVCAGRTGRRRGRNDQIANCELRIGNAERSFDNADTFIFAGF